MRPNEADERVTSAAGTASNMAAAPPSPRKFDLTSPTLNRPGEELQHSQSPSRTASHGRRPSHSTGLPSTPKTPASSSSAISPNQRRTHTPRRSVAHNPELLGLGLGSDFPRASFSSSSSGTKRVSDSGVASHRARSGSSSTAATTTDLFNYDAESEADCFELHRVDLDDVRTSMELQQQRGQQRAAPPALSSSSALHAQTEAQSQVNRQDHDKAGAGAGKTEDDDDEDEERYLPSFGHDTLPAMKKPEHEAALRLDDDPFSGGSQASHNTYGYQGHIRNGDYGAPGYQDDEYLDDDDVDYDNNDDDDDDLERGLAANQKRLLHFEAVTPRERVWMWTSVGLVMVLTAVSIAISVNWIDWPGDGLGKY